ILAVDRPVTWRPIRRASTSVTDKPASASKYAAVTPTIPAPTTTTSAVRDRASFGYELLGAVAVQQDPGLPESRVMMTSWDRIEKIAARKEVGPAEAPTNPSLPFSSRPSCPSCAPRKARLQWLACDSLLSRPCHLCRSSNCHA